MLIISTLSFTACEDAAWIRLPKLQPHLNMNMKISNKLD